MIQDILQKIGLTKGESEVYIALLKIGNTTSGAIIQKSRVSRSKVYEVLERLKQKGLVTEMIKENVKYFEATTPSRILEYLQSQEKDLQEKEKEAKRIVPDLVKLQKAQLEKQETKIYVGIEGWKTLYSEILENLKPGDEYLAFGIGPEEARDKQIQLFFRNFHLKRGEKRIKARLIMHPDTRKIMKEQFSGLKYYQYRFLDTKFPTNINLHGDNVITLVWGKNPVAFLIHSKQVAKKYKEYFEEMWKQSKA